jgi:hypothetical protein
MDRRRRAAQLGLEELACCLPREHPHERAERVVGSGINCRRRIATRVRRNSSSSPALSASSFGHDTPAHVERRFVIAGVRCGDEMGGTECGSERADLVSSAEGVFGAAIARDDGQRA